MSTLLGGFREWYTRTYNRPGRISALTFNIAFNAWTNREVGSEKVVVERCVKRYGPALDPDTGLTRCVMNAVNAMMFRWPRDGKPFDFIALQEFHFGYREAFERYLRSMQPAYARYVFFYRPYRTIFGGHGGIALIVNTETMGRNLVDVTQPDMHLTHGNDSRAIQAVYAPDVRVLMVNVHAPHGIALRSEIQGQLSKIPPGLLNPPPRRLLIAGDFNDTYPILPGERTQLASADAAIKGPEGLLARQPSVPPPRSCCADRDDYPYMGDYVLDSGGVAERFYGIPGGGDAKYPPISDHHPVALIDLA